DTTLANAVYGTDKALMSDRSNLAIWHNSDNGDETFRMLGEEPTLGGSMLGLEVGGTVRYELDDVINFPLYVQSGFHYMTRMSGGQQERTLGDVSVANPSLAGLLGLKGFDPADFSGGTMISNYDASWFEIPLTIGVKVSIKRKYSFLYGGFGASYFSGGFSVEMDVDEEYANVLSTHLLANPDAVAGYDIVNLSPGAVQDTVKFTMAGIGLNYGVGAQIGLDNGIAFYIELNSSGAAETVKSAVMKQETSQLLTALTSPTLAGVDDDWFDRLAFPVVATGAAVRIGVRYYLF
ncbi:MAG: hypothetical protein JRI25_11990, partial [Deltaproteobacteria bacterium]|nr:hypothetical protein [Deltaproteobacteria bacterium]